MKSLFCVSFSSLFLCLDGPKFTKIEKEKEEQHDELTGVKLRCISQCYPEVTQYSWYQRINKKESKNVANGTDIFVRSDQPGEYYCVAKNEIGEKSSEPIKLFDGEWIPKALTFISTVHCFYIIIHLNYIFPFLNTYIKLCGSVEWGHVNKPSTFVLTILHYLISSTYSCPGIYNSVPIIHHLLLHNVCVLKVNMCQVTLIWKVHLNRTKKKKSYTQCVYALKSNTAHWTVLVEVCALWVLFVFLCYLFTNLSIYWCSVSSNHRHSYEDCGGLLALSYFSNCMHTHLFVQVIYKVNNK